jgi:hypothetical protein
MGCALRQRQSAALGVLWATARLRTYKSIESRTVCLAFDFSVSGWTSTASSFCKGRVLLQDGDLV